MVEVYTLKNSMWYLIGYCKRAIYTWLGMWLLVGKDERILKEPFAQVNVRAEKMNEQVERLIEDYGNSILRLAYSYLHNMSDAEDLLQETLIQWIKVAPPFETKAHEKAWLLRVAINLSKNKIKYNHIRQTDELSDTLVINESADLSFVWEAVKQLPSKYSEVVHLFYHEGYSTAEIALLLSKKETTVRSLLHRARIKLKDVLKEVYDFEE